MFVCMMLHVLWFFSSREQEEGWQFWAKWWWLGCVQGNCECFSLVLVCVCVLCVCAAYMHACVRERDLCLFDGVLSVFLSCWAKRCLHLSVLKNQYQYVCIHAAPSLFLSLEHRTGDQRLWGRGRETGGTGNHAEGTRPWISKVRVFVFACCFFFFSFFFLFFWGGNS